SSSPSPSLSFRTSREPQQRSAIIGVVRKALLQRHPRIDGNRVEYAKPRIEQAETLIGIVIAVEKQPRIRRMVVALMKCLEIGIGQIRNVLWITTGIEAVDRIWEQRALGELIEPVVRRRIAPLHFIENHALVD